MWKANRKKNLDRLRALGGRIWPVGLLVLGLTPPAPAQIAREDIPVPDRIERIRTALDERGLGALGIVAGVVTPDPQDPKEDPEWDDWNDWDDWADF